MSNSIKILAVMIVFQLSLPFVAYAQDIFKAKIGIKIKSGNETRRAKAVDRIIKGDKLNIYVKPEIDSYVYIVNSNNSGTSLLNRKLEDQTVKSKIGIKFPGEGSAYSPDGNDGSETFVIIVSKYKNEKVVKLFSRGTISNKKWLASEQESMKTSSLLSTFDPQDDHNFGGSIRGGLDPFWNKLRVSAGKALITQKFEFDVKK
jgi:hypothetical protein